MSTVRHPAPPAQPIRLYCHPLSGHAHRVELFLSLLGLPSEQIHVDLLSGAQKAPAFLAKNPFGEVPVIEDDDRTIADSNAILVYLARRYDPSGAWLPSSPEDAAAVQRWLSVAAGELVQGPAGARIEVLFSRPRDPKRPQVAARLFGVLDAHLATCPFLVGERPTIADVSLYTYSAHAPEGGISLSPYPHLRAWLARVEALPGFVGMQRNADAEPLAS